MRYVWVLVSLVAVAALQAWPLPLHLSTRLTGPISGDTGVYVWDIWVFRHELLQGLDVFTTSTILSLGGPVDLSLHNYTVFADVLAFPLLPLLGVVATFNVVYLANVVLTGLGLFLLVERVYGRDHVRPTEAWVASLLFACSPFLVARSTAHFSLAAAAPLPFFVWALERFWAGGRSRDAAAVGACVAWAGFCDPYYAVYCVMLGIMVVGGHVLRLEHAPATTKLQTLRRLLDVIALTISALLIAARLGQGVVHLGPLALSMRSFYTPVLLLTAVVLTRVWLAHRWRVRWRPGGLLAVRRRLSGAVTAVVVALVLLSPELYVIAWRAAEGRLVTAPVFWRSSAPGVDLISFLLPNPNHPLAPRALVEWVAHQPGRYEENVASIPWVALGVLLAAARLTSSKARRLWIAITLFFALLTLGPFIRVAGIQTYVPTPWTLLRYVPLIGEARMPPRFGVIVIMGVAVLVAGALAALRQRYPRHRRALITGVGLALALEILPAPRTLYSARVPMVYQHIARDTGDARVLELPFGIRDGLSSMGDFSAASQFYQTLHGKPLLGGYLSRVSESTKAHYRDVPVMAALLTLSEGGALTPTEIQRAHDTADQFLRQAHVGYVVAETWRVKPELRQFAIEVLHLDKVEESEGFELFRPR